MTNKMKTAAEKQLEAAGVADPPAVVEALATLFDGVWQPRKDIAAAMLLLSMLPGLLALAHSYGLV